MTWRLGIRHCTAYQYKGEVSSSYNEARITPLTTDRQTVMDAQVQVTPAAIAFRYWDYWGTLVHAFDIHVPHDELVVVGTSVVETTPALPWVHGASWQDLARPETRDRFAELLVPTSRVPASDEITAAAASMARLPTPSEACHAAVEWVMGRMRYEAGTTTVSTSAADALEQGSGVCQDFAHVTLALLRALGIPARYISGYLHPSPDAELGVAVAGQSHAWVDSWIGDWHPLDPTNGGRVAERHVVVGRARDYADVPPLTGIYHGEPTTHIDVTVELTRLA